ncbi:hypothetical protein EsH8_IX_000984 [Colletotrichum jinshuiense]
MLIYRALAILGASSLAAATSSITASPPNRSTGSIPLKTGIPPPTTLVSVTQTSTSSSSSTPTTSSSTSSASASTVTSRAPPTTVTVTLEPSKPNTYEECGGLRATPKPCPASFVCIDDPFRKGCGMACDQPGICVVPSACGGIANIKCPAGKYCVDDPRDDCHPKTGGADCGGICV